MRWREAAIYLYSITPVAHRRTRSLGYGRRDSYANESDLKDAFSISLSYPRATLLRCCSKQLEQRRRRACWEMSTLRLTNARDTIDKQRKSLTHIANKSDNVLVVTFTLFHARLLTVMWFNEDALNTISGLRYPLSSSRSSYIRLEDFVEQDTDTALERRME